MATNNKQDNLIARNFLFIFINKHLIMADLRKPRQLHPDNLPDDSRYIPAPSDESAIPEKYRKELTNLSARQLVNQIWIKYRYKVQQTIWLVNTEQKTVEFRFYEQIFKIKYKDESELNQWLNIQLLKTVGCTLDMYWLFYKLYSRSFSTKNGETTSMWRGIAPK